MSPQGPPHQSTPYYGGGYSPGAEQRQEYPPNPPPYKRDDSNYQPVRTTAPDVPLLLILTIFSPPDHLRVIQKVVLRLSIVRPLDHRRKLIWPPMAKILSEVSDHNQRAFPSSVLLIFWSHICIHKHCTI
ncbi:uncharacterized protein BT62DRAFT_183444 [Guyanagaster necrorhizus]|uniref:Uncharacterized protein n=1 Tax=Guyanagaster necrorhizus TaxID=856835 RepID=A0A9P8ARS1_9AGAR|nr:uncharacterized protein BT62DRAFT_183444 [Guyanagaster necrorhizus MCA 3950]KAG7445206.1 hypothetical protein BT62DRAFT_183444 [Guyanagaster necrorhizus MCA 3950]